MTISAAATRQIIEDLYGQALVLADEVRAAFDSRNPGAELGLDESARVALSVEGLRTTTRLMHSLAWLLNQRAYLAGELSDVQVREQGRLPSERPPIPGMFKQLDPETQALVRQSIELYERMERLDRDWRAGGAMAQSPVGAMHGMLARAFGT